MTHSTSLGKRKRISRDPEVNNARVPVVGSQSCAIEQDGPGDAEADIFKKAFEARFKPLDPVTSTIAKAQSPEEVSESDESEWEGLSIEAEDVEVIEASNEVSLDLSLDKAQRKAFMVR